MVLQEKVKEAYIQYKDRAQEIERVLIVLRAELVETVLIFILKLARTIIINNN